MTESSPQIAEPSPLGCAGVAALLFAASPSISLVLVSIVEFQQRRGQPQGGPVGFGVPPIWLIWLILLGVSLPWVIVGILLLRGVSAARGVALLLTLPTAVVTVATAIGTIIGMNAHDEFAAQHVRAFGPMAFFGMMFCLTVWGIEYSFWTQGERTERPFR